MNLFKIIFVMISMSFLASCASVNIAKENTLASPKAGHGVVYFYREAAFQGWAASYNIWENEQTPRKLGALGNGNYFYTYLTPGKYTFFVNGEVRNATNIDVKSGQTYYLQNRIDVGFWAGRPKLTEVTENEGLRQIKDGKLKMSVLEEKK